MNKEIIAPVSDNDRYLLYEESININSRLESKDRLMVYFEDVYYNFFEDQELITWGFLLK